MMSGADNSNKVNSALVIAILFFVFLFHSFSNYYILHNSRFPLGPDSLAYVRHVFNIYTTIQHHEVDNWGSKVFMAVFQDTFKPPFLFLSAVPLASLFGFDKNTVVMANIFFLGVLLFSSYHCGRLIFNSRWVGLLSAIIISNFPPLFAFSRVFMTEFALVAMVSLTFYLFLLDKWDNLLFSALTGVIVGLGFLTKQSYAVFFIPFVLMFIANPKNIRNTRRLKNSAIFVLIASLVAAFFYAQVLLKQDSYLINNVFAHRFENDPLFYLRLLSRGSFVFPAILCLLLAGFLIRTKKYSLLAVTLVPVLLFSMVGNKMWRYLLPVVPPLIIAFVGMLWGVPRFKKTIFIGLGAASFVVFFCLTYQSRGLIASKLESAFSLKPFPRSIDNEGLLTFVDLGDWETPATQIIKEMQARYRIELCADPRAKILVIGQKEAVWTTIEYLRLKKFLFFETLRPGNYDDFVLKNPQTIMDINKEITESHFVLLQEVPKDEPWLYADHAKQLANAFIQRRGQFEYLKTFIFPAGLRCDLYENVPLRRGL